MRGALERSGAFSAIIGDDPGLRATLARTALVAPTGTPVLVTGESGTGKELLARALHELGPNPSGPFVAVNCGALPRELAESELFGHERGAFTGAAARRAGWFEEASGGTLVLDEIGELPLDLQPKLLRVLESGRLRRVGGAGEIAVPVRVVAMTLRDLEGEVQRRTFRPDLYYRLAGICVRLPPLRERRGDIARLAAHFLREIEPEVGPRELEPIALATLAAADWPGNVRELRNVIRRAAILTGGQPDRRIGPEALELPPAGLFRLAEAPVPDEVSGEARGAARTERPPSMHPAEDAIRIGGRTFDEIEREVFSWALRRNAGSRRRAARALDVARSTFCDKVRRYSL
ncbi:MAG TPA: sigma-54 dependent transcriptional regulator [Polyangia bacterium]|nr:sigma-54 dependent transcriptional regulator [Polyangia bacterium]